MAQTAGPKQYGKKKFDVRLKRKLVDLKVDIELLGDSKGTQDQYKKLKSQYDSLLNTAGAPEKQMELNSLVTVEALDKVRNPEKYRKQSLLEKGVKKITSMFTNNKGGVILKTNKEKMAYGGMASGKKHMYATGGSVKDNAGLRALQKASPMAYNKIKGIV